MNIAVELRPHISVRAAQTLDGRISLLQKRTLLSCREGLETAHRSRAEHDAVMVGSSTIRIDNPRLSVRYCTGPQPKRVILASTLNIPTDSHVFAPGQTRENPWVY
jgi:riboflavin biosynthesis pyrimidine reductase